MKGQLCEKASAVLARPLQTLREGVESLLETLPLPWIGEIVRPEVAGNEDPVLESLIPDPPKEVQLIHIFTNSEALERGTERRLRLSEGVEQVGWRHVGPIEGVLVASGDLGREREVPEGTFRQVQGFGIVTGCCRFEDEEMAAGEVGATAHDLVNRLRAQRGASGLPDLSQTTASSAFGSCSAAHQVERNRLRRTSPGLRRCGVLARRSDDQRSQPRVQTLERGAQLGVALAASRSVFSTRSSADSIDCSWLIVVTSLESNDP